MSFLESLVAKYKAAKTHRANVTIFRDKLLAAAADGVLTDQEVRDLDGLRSQLGIEEKDVAAIRVKAYQRAFGAAAHDGAITADEEHELNRLQLYLALPESDISKTKRQLARLRLIAELQVGNLPTINTPTIILQKAEVPHWSEPAHLIEERVVGRRYVGSSHGVSIRIAKGVSYRVGASRGHLVVDKANVPVSTGDLVLTSKRVIFRGDKKSFNYRLDKLLDVQLFSEGLHLTDTSGKPRLLQFRSDDNADIVGSILTQTINRFVEAH